MGIRLQPPGRFLRAALAVAIALGAAHSSQSYARGPGGQAPGASPPIAATGDIPDRTWLDESMRRYGTLPKGARQGNLQSIEELVIGECELRIRLVREYPALKRRIVETAVIPLAQMDPAQVRARPYRAGDDVALLRIVARKDAEAIQVSGVISNEGVADEPFATKESTYAVYLYDVDVARRVALALADVVKRCGAAPPEGR